MTRTALRSLAPLLLVASASIARGGHGEGRSPSELRETLREFYLFRLGQELRLDDAERERIRPRVEEYLEIRGSSLREVMRATRALRRAVKEADGAVVAERLAERDRAEELAWKRSEEARAALLVDLTPRRAAAFLVFEERFHHEVRERVRSLRGDRPGQGAPSAEPDARAGARGQDTDDRGSNRASRTSDRRDELVLRVSLELRRLGLSVPEVLELLPAAEELVAVQVETRARRRQDRRTLVRALESSGTTDAELEGLVSAWTAADAEAERRLRAATRALTAGLRPDQAAQLTLRLARPGGRGPGDARADWRDRPKRPARPGGSPWRR